MAPQTNDPDRFQILALDGGGAKALFTAHLLARLEDDLGFDTANTFDLIAGTSAGGILALALGAGIRPAELAERYSDLATAVFPAKRRRWHRWFGPRLMSPTYRPEPLRAALHDVLGDRLLGDSSKRLVIPSWDTRSGTVHIFKTPHDPRFTRDWKIPMADVAMATSAAPVYLPAAEVDMLRLIDGGIWANNPSVVAITEAVGVLGVPLESIRVLNVGTTDEVTDHNRKLDHGGFVTWARSAVDVILTASTRGNQGIARHLLPKDAYWRFDASVAKGRYRLDKADLGEITALASQQARQLSPIVTDHFCGHRAAPYLPCHSVADSKEPR